MRLLILLTFCAAAVFSKDVGDYRPKPGRPRPKDGILSDAIDPRVTTMPIIRGPGPVIPSRATVTPAGVTPTVAPQHADFIRRTMHPPPRPIDSQPQIHKHRTRKPSTTAKTAPTIVAGNPSPTQGPIVSGPRSSVVTRKPAQDPSRTIGPIIIGPGPTVGTTKQVLDASRTVVPIVISRDFGGSFGAEGGSGRRTIYNGGVQGSTSNGRTTWTGGVDHTTDLRNGNTQVHGGFETKVGSGTLYGGAQVNVDNHGRTSHGANVGVKIPF